MLITYRQTKLFESDSKNDFIQFMDKFLQEKFKYKSIENILDKLNEFFNINKKIGYKELQTFCYSLSERSTILQVKFWFLRGWTEIEAKEKISTLQIGNGLKYSEKQKLNPESYAARTSTQVGYWIKKGLTKEEATNKIKERQSVFSRDKIIKKYGEKEGLNRLKERNVKWINSLTKNNDMNELNKSKAISLEKMIDKYGYDKVIIKYDGWIKACTKTCIENLKNSSMKKASKQSLVIFEEFYYKLINIFGIKNLFMGIQDNKEFFIKDTDRLYFYDFTILPLKLIFEYNGSHIHPNKNVLNEKEWNTWEHKFTKQSANDVFKFDQYKNKLAVENGFDVIVLWDSDTIEHNKLIVSESIKSKLNKIL